MGLLENRVVRLLIKLVATILIYIWSRPPVIVQDVTVKVDACRRKQAITCAENPERFVCRSAKTVSDESVPTAKRFFEQIAVYDAALQEEIICARFAGKKRFSLDTWLEIAPDTPNGKYSFRSGRSTWRLPLAGTGYAEWAETLLKAIRMGFCLPGKLSLRMEGRVTISRPFYMSVHEVTQEQWERLIGHNPSRYVGSNLPVHNVSWEDAATFVQRLNRAARRPSPYRLPTEAEWEYACRAGSMAAFCYGNLRDRLAAHAWYDDNAEERPHPVGKRQPNAWGLYDMHGNVAEWCQDRFDFYSEKAVVDPVGPDKGLYRVVRGGGWESAAFGCRSACRSKILPGARRKQVGFRLVLPAE